MAKGPESKVKADVKAYLTSIGAYWFMPVQMGYGASTLDFLVCYRGRFVAVECKAKGKMPTARQRLTIKQVERNDGLAFLVDAPGQLKVFMESYFS
jgi:hypothetical protein